MSLEECRRVYDERHASRHGNPKGASRRDVAALERSIGTTLPESYREFLLWMGDDEQGVFAGSEWFIGDIEGNYETLRDLMEDNGLPPPARGETLAFFSHQGYIAGWFHLPCESDDPTCFYFNEATASEGIVEYESFSAFLLTDLGGRGIEPPPQ